VRIIGNVIQEAIATAESCQCRVSDSRTGIGQYPKHLEDIAMVLHQQLHDAFSVDFEFAATMDGRYLVCSDSDYLSNRDTAQ